MDLNSPRALFAELASNEIDGVYGVERFVFGTPTKKVLVLIGTHGKEINTGLLIYEFLMTHGTEFLDVDLTIAIGNLYAAAKAIEAEGDSWKDYRFIDKDMNRLPADLAALEGEASEYARALQLRRLIGDVDAVIDVHSTDGVSECAGLGILGSQEKTDALFARLALVRTVYTDVAKTQEAKGTKTSPHSALYKGALAIEVECGQTRSEQAPLNALSIFRNWAAFLGILAEQPSEPTKKKVYRVVDSVMAPNDKFAVTDADFLIEHAEVKKGDMLLADNEGDQISAPCDGQLIWCPCEQVLTKGDVASEIWFIVQAAA